MALKTTSEMPGVQAPMLSGSKPARFEVWAQLFLCAEDCDRTRHFFVSELGIKPKFVVRRPHITVYHARRPMAGLTSIAEAARIVVPVSETRFMVLAPGGENPRPELEPAARKVGIRVRRRTEGMQQILEYRDRMLSYETPSVLGTRRPSTRKTSAFGARNFQAHMALLRAGSGIPRDLRKVGVPFRERIGSLLFDRFQVEIVARP